MSNLSMQQIDGLRSQIEKELARIVNETREEMRPDLKENYVDIVGSVPDIGDEAVADILIDTDNAIIGRHLQQVRDMDAALERIRTGVYGVCVGCASEVGFERLTVYPTAKRCIECQSSHEKTHAGNSAPTL